MITFPEEWPGWERDFEKYKVQVNSDVYFTEFEKLVEPKFGEFFRRYQKINPLNRIIAERILNDTNERLSGKVVTKISLLKNYCPAEEYHQKYLEKR